MSNINWLFTARSHCTEPLTARGPGMGVHELSNLAQGGDGLFLSTTKLSATHSLKARKGGTEKGLALAWQLES